MAELIEVEQVDGCQMCLGAKGGVSGNENRLGDLVVCDYCTSALLPALATMQAREAELVGALEYCREQATEGKGAFVSKIVRRCATAIRSASDERG